MTLETNEQALRRLYPDHFTRILEEMHAQGLLATKAWLAQRASGAVLQSTIYWAATSEGHHYWSLLASNVEGNGRG